MLWLIECVGVRSVCLQACGLERFHCRRSDPSQSSTAVSRMTLNARTSAMLSSGSVGCAMQRSQPNIIIISRTDFSLDPTHPFTRLCVRYHSCCSQPVAATVLPQTEQQQQQQQLLLRHRQHSADANFATATPLLPRISSCLPAVGSVANFR